MWSGTRGASAAERVQDRVGGAADARRRTPTQASRRSTPRCAGENYCENHDPGAPEITACRGGACARFDGRVHVHDAAARGWILPHIIALAEDRAVARRLETLRAIMTREDPRDRPTFDGLLRFLGRS